MNIKKLVLFFIRIFITLILLYFIYSKIDFNLLKNIFLNSKYIYFLIALLIFIISNITGGIQYYFLLRSQKINHLPFLELIKIYLYSAFFNNFLPTNIGGDGVKAYKLIKLNIDKKIIFSSILWDRLINIFILTVISLFTGYILIKKAYLLYLLFFIFVLSIIFILLVLKFNFGKTILKIVKKIKNEKIQYFLSEFLSSFKIYIKKSNLILLFYSLSLLTQFLKVFFTFFIGLAINFYIPLGELLFILPVIGIVSSLPISINGLGLREYIGRILFSFFNKDLALVSIFITLGNIIIMLGNSLGVIFSFQNNYSKVRKI